MHKPSTCSAVYGDSTDVPLKRERRSTQKVSMYVLMMAAKSDTIIAKRDWAGGTWPRRDDGLSKGTERLDTTDTTVGKERFVVFLDRLLSGWMTLEGIE